jgi:hypothetical protein
LSESSSLYEESSASKASKLFVFEVNSFATYSNNISRSKVVLNPALRKMQSHPFVANLH